jgi:hypothetical protein
MRRQMEGSHGQLVADALGQGYELLPFPGTVGFCGSNTVLNRGHWSGTPHDSVARSQAASKAEIAVAVWMKPLSLKVVGSRVLDFGHYCA